MRQGHRAFSIGRSICFTRFPPGFERQSKKDVPTGTCTKEHRINAGWVTTVPMGDDTLVPRYVYIFLRLMPKLATLRMISYVSELD